MPSLVLDNGTGKFEKVGILRNQHSVLVPNTAIFSHVNVSNPRTAKKLHSSKFVGYRKFGSFFFAPKNISEQH